MKQTISVKNCSTKKIVKSFATTSYDKAKALCDKLDASGDGGVIVSNNEQSKSYFKIEFTSAFGNGIYVIETHEIQDAKNAFYHHMTSSLAKVVSCSKTNKKVTKNMDKRSSYFVCFN
jgi:hypothetical protein